MLSLLVRSAMAITQRIKWEFSIKDKGGMIDEDRVRGNWVVSVVDKVGTKYEG